MVMAAMSPALGNAVQPTFVRFWPERASSADVDEYPKLSNIRQTAENQVAPPQIQVRVRICITQCAPSLLPSAVAKAVREWHMKLQVFNATQAPVR